MKRISTAILMVICIVFGLAGAALAGWDDCEPLVPHGGLVKNAVQAVADGQGGSLIAWYTLSPSAVDTIYVTRVDDTGLRLWTASWDTEYIAQGGLSIAGDGAGGAFVLYRGGTGIETLVRRIASDGAFVGLPHELAQDPGYHLGELAIAPDHNGGAWAVYVRRDADLKYSLNADHLDEYGISEFSLLMYNRQVFMEVGTPIDFDIDTTEDGACYVAYATFVGVSDERDVLLGYSTIDGVSFFGETTECIVDSLETDQSSPAIACLDDGSAIVVFHHECDYSGLYAQRVEPLDPHSWGAGGVPVYATNYGTSTSGADVVSDGAGGAIVAFKNTNDTFGRDGIIAQRFDDAGAYQWSEGLGRPGKLVTEFEAVPRLQTHGLGGAILAWKTDNAFYAEAVDAKGNQMWPDGDHLLCPDVSWYLEPSIHGDGDHGAYVVAYGGASGGNEISGALVPWTIIETTEPDYEILSSSQSSSFQPQDDGSFDVGFSWKTYGITNVSYDHVELAGSATNGTNCWLEPGETIDLYRSQSDVDVRIYPSPDGAWIHELTWNRPNCVLPCTYVGNAYSGDGLNQSQGARVTLAVRMCPGDPGLKAATFEPATPNPFNPATTLRFYVPGAATNVRLEIYNLRGERVRSFAASGFASGWNELVWQGRNDHGGEVGSGVYFARLDVDGSVLTEKLVLLK